MNGIEGLLPAGKLPHSLLGELLAGLPHDDPRLLLGPTVGEDAAVIDFAPGSDRLLVAKSDPITFATDQIGYYAVNVCVNDLAVAGATPRYYFPTLLLPAGLHRLYILRDRDPAGDHALDRLAARALEQGVAPWDLLPERGDFNDDLRRLGPDLLRERLRGQIHPGDASRFAIG